MKRLAIIAICCVPVLGCFEFDSVTQVIDFRVLAVSADPPEIRPGDGVTLTVLWADPEGRGRAVTFAWMGCSGAVHPSEGIATCDMLVPPVVRTAENGGDVLEIPATPPDLLDGMPADSAVQFTFITLMCAGGELPAPDAYDGLRDTRDINTLCTGGDALSSFKLVTISNAETLQTNPTIDHMTYGGRLLAPADTGAVGQMACGGDDSCEREVDMALFVTPESIETFEVIEFDKPVIKEDTVFISWFVTGGDFTQFRSGESCEKADTTMGNPCRSTTPTDPVGPFEVRWVPEDPGTFTVYAVAHDIRGGVSWERYTVEAVR